MSSLHRYSHLWPGVPLALGSAVLFGAASPVSKLLLSATHPFMLAGLLYLGAGLGLAAHRLVGTAAGRKAEAQLRRSDLPWLMLAIAAGGVIAPVALMLGLARTAASNGALLLNLEGLATMAIAWAVYRENVDRRLLLGAFAILAGAAILSWQETGVKLDAGALWITGGCLAWGIENNVTRKISAADPALIAMLKGLVAGSVNVAIALTVGASLPVAVAAGMLGLIAIGVSLVLFILALRHLGTARTGAYYSLAPFVGALLSVAVLGETITAQILVAGGLMAFGLWLHLSERHDHWHDHEAIGHEHAHIHDEHHQHNHDRLVTEPHTHWHRHEPLRHKHLHFPDLHHRHEHG